MNNNQNGNNQLMPQDFTNNQSFNTYTVQINALRNVVINNLQNSRDLLPYDDKNENPLLHLHDFKTLQGYVDYRTEIQECADAIINTFDASMLSQLTKVQRYNLDMLHRILVITGQHIAQAQVQPIQMIQAQQQPAPQLRGLGMGKTTMMRPVTTFAMRKAKRFGRIEDELSGTFNSSDFSSSISTRSMKIKKTSNMISKKHETQVDKFFGKRNGNDKGQGGGKGGFAM